MRSLLCLILLALAAPSVQGQALPYRRYRDQLGAERQANLRAEIAALQAQVQGQSTLLTALAAGRKPQIGEYQAPAPQAPAPQLYLLPQAPSTPPGSQPYQQLQPVPLPYQQLVPQPQPYQQLVPQSAPYQQLQPVPQPYQPLAPAPQPYQPLTPGQPYQKLVPPGQAKPLVPAPGVAKPGPTGYVMPPATSSDPGPPTGYQRYTHALSPRR